MKKLNKFIKPIPKEKIITAICISIAAVSIVLSTLLFVTAKNNEAEDKSNSNHAENEAIETQRVTYPSDSPKSLEFQSNGDGTCVVMSIGGFTAEELEIPEKSPDGDIVTGIAADAFDGCDQLLSIFIPYTVESIGERAFKGCTSLVVIRVDSGNRSFASSGGILFTKNKSTLLCYPARRVGNNYLLNSNVTCIADYAFYGVKNLSKINYEQSVAEFATIEIGEGNKAFSDLPVTCNYYPTK